MGLGRGHRPPQPLGGGAQFGVAGLGGHVRRTGQQIQLAHGVPLDGDRLAQRHAVLAVRLAAEQAVAVTVDEVTGEIR